MKEVLEHLLQAIGKLFLLAAWVCIKTVHEVSGAMERWMKQGIK
jgi:hypothetical protein